MDAKSGALDLVGGSRRPPHRCWHPVDGTLRGSVQHGDGGMRIGEVVEKST